MMVEKDDSQMSLEELVRSVVKKKLNFEMDEEFRKELSLTAFGSNVSSIPIQPVGENTSFLWVFTALFASLCCATMGFLLYIRFKRKEKRLSVDVETPLTYPTSDNSFLHERIGNLNYDVRYEIDSKNVKLGQFLGGGNFGAVYEGTFDISRQYPSRSILPKISQVTFFCPRMQTVAIKATGEAKTPEAIQLRKNIMESELKLMCSVKSHPNIVTLIGAITRQNNGDGVQIIMEKCNEGSLYSFLFARKNAFVPQFVKKLNTIELHESDQQRESEEEILDSEVIYKNHKNKANLNKEISTAHLLSFAMQIAEGMEYLASNKCLHRDLAARNILLTSEGLCKIADFGLAKRIGYQEYYRTDLNQELPQRWMAVECLRDYKFTIESDIWSYGILLYEIFTLSDIPYPNITGDVSQYIIDGLRNDQPQYCPDEIYHHMTLCWDSDTTNRPRFSESATLMRKHLSLASKEVEEKVKNLTFKETKRQRHLEVLRSQTPKHL